jgi:hypothetical protein
LDENRLTRLRYEDFLADPRQVLDGLGEWLEVDLSNIDVDRLSTGAIFQGNRLMRDGVVAIRSDSHVRSWSADPVTSLVQAPWLMAHGYRLMRTAPR